MRPAMTRLPVVYLGRSRLQRNRANLIQTLQMMEAFRQAGVDATLYLPPWPGSLDLESRLRDFGIESSLDIRSSWLLNRRWNARPFVRLYGRRLRKALGVYTRSVQISATLAAAGIPHQLEIHEAERELIGKGYLAGIVKHHRQGLIGWLVPISHAAADVLIRAGAVAERVLVSPSGTKLSAFDRIPAFDPDRLSAPRIVYLGRLSRDRGLDVFQEIAATEIADVTLVGEQEDTVQASGKLHVVPFVPHRDVPTWWERSDLVLLPYQRSLPHADSISPIKLFEAMAAGRPIIVSDLPAIREIVDHEKTALLVEPADTGGWIAAIRRLQNDPQLACRLAQAAKQKAREYSWEKRAERIAKACGWI
jgi:glycosyltransferase involved in cell wall biosynthesis